MNAPYGFYKTWGAFQITGNIILNLKYYELFSAFQVFEPDTVVAVFGVGKEVFKNLARQVWALPAMLVTVFDTACRFVAHAPKHLSALSFTTLATRSFAPTADFAVRSAIGEHIIVDRINIDRFSVG